ncbi:MAG: hypothetical protein E6Q75_10810 [Rheinheimera sp.]|nr:MAG: hypothetical protein E6Q75_10810 [Rheinheimera sp.]
MVTTSSVISQDALRIAARTQAGIDRPRTDTSEQRRQVVQQAELNQQQNTLNALPENTTTEQQSDSVRVSSTLGKAASSGLLTRDEALAIYQKIANML